MPRGIRLSDAIDSFIAAQRARRRAPGTLQSYRWALGNLMAVTGNINVSSLRPQHFDAFWEAKCDWKPRSLNLARTHFNGFLNWCLARRYLNSTLGLLESQRFKVDEKERLLIPQDQFSTLLGNASNPRVRIAMACGLYLFTRVSETQALRVQDIHAGEVSVWRSKTRTTDELPLCEELADEVDRWKFAYAAKVGETLQPNWFLIPGQSIPSLAPGSNQTLGLTYVPETYYPTRQGKLGVTITNELKRAGYYAIGEGTHTLRRSGAVALYNQLSSVGHDRAIRIVQAMLGHSSVQTTEVYLRLSLDRKVRNDVLSGKRMFPGKEEAKVIEFKSEGLGRSGRY